MFQQSNIFKNSDDCVTNIKTKLKEVTYLLKQKQFFFQCFCSNSEQNGLIKGRGGDGELCDSMAK